MCCKGTAGWDVYYRYVYLWVYSFRLCFELPLFLLHPVVVKYQLLLLEAEHILQLIL